MPPRKAPAIYVFVLLKMRVKSINSKTMWLLTACSAEPMSQAFNSTASFLHISLPLEWEPSEADPQFCKIHHFLVDPINEEFDKKFQKKFTFSGDDLIGEQSPPKTAQIQLIANIVICYYLIFNL